MFSVLFIPYVCITVIKLISSITQFYSSNQNILFLRDLDEVLLRMRASQHSSWQVFDYRGCVRKYHVCQWKTTALNRKITKPIQKEIYRSKSICVVSVLW